MRITIAASVLAALLVVSTIGGGVAAKRPSRPSGGGGGGGGAARRPGGGGRSRGGSGSGGGGGRPRGPPPHSKPRRRPAPYGDKEDYDDPEDDSEDDIPFGFPDDADDDDVDDDENEFDSDAAYEEYDERPMPAARRPSGKRGPPMVGGPSRKGRGGRGGPPPPPSTRARGNTMISRTNTMPLRMNTAPPLAVLAAAAVDRRPDLAVAVAADLPAEAVEDVVAEDPSSRTAVQQPGAFSRGLSAIRDRVPDVATVRDAALSSVAAAKETTTKLSSNVYREVKGLTSSELEQVMLKATRPDDAPVKGKHVERLVGVTYQISGRYDIYDAVLRKLWSKMAEKDWRTTLKALYILHRFSADGAPDHQTALKARLRELRRTRDPKRKGAKFFNSKTLLSGDDSPEAKPYVEFMARYAHYVVLRAQCFGGMFSEISQETSGPPSSSRSSKSKAAATKPITATALRTENLEGAKMILKAGCACALKDDEVCESTAMCVERVVSDLIGLTTATAVALNRALKGGRDSKGADPAIVKKWCEFYSDELLPQTKGLMKRTTPELDAYGMFLPSRMGASVSGELLKKGLQGGDDEGEEAAAAAGEAKVTNSDVKEKKETEVKASEETAEAAKEEEAELEEVDDDDLYDEYSYDEYYDDEEA
eukprot:CAMPEP_0178513484 /NCGR_PEP_ID=MMETSP0696-20121128/23503_1 /TAXON_ID=265572 /ORGANISM="Extubocellulus spinifer, Strain CCMP396" /LENGTH=649 /DNA_ID=CAMNT_0020143493 /DNA_START=240 /DNA_END=2188 /DNA_ORIENTATION=-